MSTRVLVSIGGADVPVGLLHSHRSRSSGRRSTESATFRYDDTYLSRADAYALDPALPLRSAAQQTGAGLPLFRAIADASPDRWGRDLLVRQERLRARVEGTAPRCISELDLLLGLRDDLRQGALRYQSLDDPRFLTPPAAGVPLLTDLPALLIAADRVASDEATGEDLALLVRAGGSLGGTRPKAHVMSDGGRPAIAKFPSPASDTWNVVAWEKTALDLARLAGVEVSPSQLVKVDDRDVLVVERFDRSDGERIGYASAATMLGVRDGEPAGYLDIALVLEERSSRTSAELEQLWRRIAFNILSSNTDDHLGNHGFLHRRGDVWSLSPAFDLNPDPAPGKHVLRTAINGHDSTADIDVLMSVAPRFRLREEAARHLLRVVALACSRWREIARSNGLRTPAIDQMAGAFEHDAARAALPER